MLQKVCGAWLCFSSGRFSFTVGSPGFLCPLSANTYELAFLSFVMKDYKTKELIFKIGEDAPLPEVDFDEDNFDPDSLRKIRYDFSVDVLRKETISTTYGPQQVQPGGGLCYTCACALPLRNCLCCCGWSQACVLEWARPFEWVPHD